MHSVYRYQLENFRDTGRTAGVQGEGMEKAVHFPQTIDDAHLDCISNPSAAFSREYSTDMSDTRAQKV